jgi:2-polyprenyl-3-methyl-5-hydroxy-6-metoxy-1,4-benzoquinol methylase
MQKNAQLQEFYDGVYKKGELQHYTQFRLKQGDWPVEFTTVLNLIDWTGKAVLDVGCGTGDMCAMVKEAGAHSVLGIDFAASAIEEAHKKYQLPDLSFRAENVFNIDQSFDVIMSLGTLEHMDDPLAALKKYKQMLHPRGSLILTCPNWLNPRGYVLQTLLHLFNAPITKADIHYLSGVDFEAWAKELDMSLEWQTVDFEWGSGMKMIRDLVRRLPNVMRDAQLPVTQEQITGLLQWLEKGTIPFPHERKQEGAVGVYHLTSR